ncbi:MAG: BspA family leucine-rich repeat surface protein, partial [Coriobacteriia bacterium]|nr:BspA family leucine-rich repeat surface protein [Coriobacteriia bacterium]
IDKITIGPGWSKQFSDCGLEETYWNDGETTHSSDKLVLPSDKPITFTKVSDKVAIQWGDGDHIGEVSIEDPEHATIGRDDEIIVGLKVSVKAQDSDKRFKLTYTYEGGSGSVDGEAGASVSFNMPSKATSLSISYTDPVLKAVYDGNENVKTLTFYYDSEPHTGDNIKVYDNLKTDAEDDDDWAYDENRGNINKVIINDSMKQYTGFKSTAYMCSNMDKAADIEGFENLNTTNVENMRGMFYRYGKGSKDTPSSLTKVPNLTGFITTNVKNMYGMFQEYGQYSNNALDDLDMSAFKTDNVETDDLFLDMPRLNRIKIGYGWEDQFSDCGLEYTYWKNIADGHVYKSDQIVFPEKEGDTITYERAKKYTITWDENSNVEYIRVTDDKDYYESGVSVTESVVVSVAAVSGYTPPEEDKYVIHYVTEDGTDHTAESSTYPKFNMPSQNTRIYFEPNTAYLKSLTKSYNKSLNNTQLKATNKLDVKKDSATKPTPFKKEAIIKK